jgi:hypothetical protein
MFNHIGNIALESTAANANGVHRNQGRGLGGCPNEAEDAQDRLRSRAAQVLRAADK